jgi:hypothetical protein
LIKRGIHILEMACPYSTLLGIPGQGIHAQRFLGIALNDTIMTIILAAFSSIMFNINFFLSLLTWLVVGEILHYIFGVNTAFLKFLGIIPCPSS